jgi:predicted lipid-binding transport protein (Tim44 family)
MSRLGARAFAVFGGLCAASRVLARAGGGGHGGGGHSSSSSSGGFSGGSHSTIVNGSGGGGAVIAILIATIILFIIVRRIARAQAAAGGAPGAPPVMMRTAATAALGAAAVGAAARGAFNAARIAPDTTLVPVVDRIRAKDPGFELEVFLQRAEMIFFLVKRGIQHNDPTAVRPYLGDALFAAVSGAVTAAKTQHRHALLESLNVRAVHVQSAESDAAGQSIMVHFDLVYRAKTLDDANRVLADEGEDHRHGERWLFTRKADAKTPVNGGVVAARCPVCGAELRLNLDGTCSHCRSSVTNGAADWVVADVQNAPFMGYTGNSSLAVAASSVPEGVASLHAADPSFAMDAFIGRTKTAFRALQEAWCAQNLDAGRAFLSPGAYFSWRAQLETMAAEGRRNVMENLVVRRIDPVLIVHGRVFDDITVRITATAADFEIDQNNRVVFGDRTVRPFTEDWTFQRSVGVATTQKPGTLENTCPSCGAPIALTQIGECRYCKAAVTSGKFDWVVSRIEQDEVDAQDPGAGSQVGRDIALQVGGAIVGGLLTSLLSGNNSSKNDWN